MSALNRLDSMVLRKGSLINRSPFEFSFYGELERWRATTGARDTMVSLTEGGVHNDEEFTALVEAAQFDGEEAPDNGDKLSVYLDANGVPCLADEAVGQPVTVKVKHVTRAGGGITYTLRTDTRG